MLCHEVRAWSRRRDGSWRQKGTRCSRKRSACSSVALVVVVAAVVVVTPAAVSAGAGRRRSHGPGDRSPATSPSPTTPASRRWSTSSARGARRATLRRRTSLAFAAAHPDVQFVGVAVDDTEGDVTRVHARVRRDVPRRDGRRQPGAGSAASTASRRRSSSTRTARNGPHIVGAATLDRFARRWPRPGARRPREEACATASSEAVEITSLSLSAIGLAFAAGLAVVRLAVRAAAAARVPVVRLRRRGRAAWAASAGACSASRCCSSPGSPPSSCSWGRAPAASAGSSSQHREELTIVAGAFIAFSGLVVAGVVRLPEPRARSRQARRRRRRLPHRRGPRHRLDALRRVRPGRHPHHGRHQSERRLGSLLLLVYSLGLGVPFVLAALAFDWVRARLAFIKRHYRAVPGRGRGAARRVRRAADVRRAAAHCRAGSRLQPRPGSDAPSRAVPGPGPGGGAVSLA